ncbi:MAG: hypothetical protein Q4F53_05555 [Nesterenkonia sp.]|nr:hypothetical protein [Nesterenkonia sp.]
MRSSPERSPEYTPEHASGYAPEWERRATAPRPAGICGTGRVLCPQAATYEIVWNRRRNPYLGPDLPRCERYCARHYAVELSRLTETHDESCCRWIGHHILRAGPVGRSQPLTERPVPEGLWERVDITVGSDPVLLHVPSLPEGREPDQVLAYGVAMCPDLRPTTLVNRWPIPWTRPRADDEAVTDVLGLRPRPTPEFDALGWQDREVMRREMFDPYAELFEGAVERMLTRFGRITVIELCAGEVPDPAWPVVPLRHLGRAERVLGLRCMVPRPQVGETVRPRMTP